MASVAIVVVAFALWKPWIPPGEERRVLVPTNRTGVETLSPVPNPTASPTPGPTPPLGAVPCVSAQGWRVVARETTAGREVQTWIAVEPVPASGPDDAAVPFVRVVAGRLRGMGYCLPRAMMMLSHDARAWLVETTDGQVGVSELPLNRLSAPFRGYADLYAPPPGQLRWAAGHYVVAVTVGARAAAWFGVEVVDAESDRPAPRVTATPTAPPPPASRPPG